ncbi:MAG: hypothetical protein WC764_03405 [Candidatus Paceibacterota bacterium]|jgi:predicted GH43/DUF377 family glycosyl hydrolase
MGALNNNPNNFWPVVLFFLAIFALAFFYHWLTRKKISAPVILLRLPENPILSPVKEHWWESEAVFNPAAFVDDGKVHLFYRALGRDGISRIGYAWSTDGLHFERLSYPVFSAENVQEVKSHFPYTSPVRLSYDTVNNPSGGGWGGLEDPRAIKIDGRIYLTFNAFNGWESMRVGLTSISEEDFKNKNWNWRKFVYLTDERNKNWMFFPDKINDKFALLHSIYSENGERVQIKYLDSLHIHGPLQNLKSADPHRLKDQKIAWHYRIRSAGTPPLRTKYGWLVLYHAMDPNEPSRYKVGALLLDLASPTKVIARSDHPILEPDMWYENDWKPGIVYASGAVVLGEDLMVYYGGGDKYVAGAKVNLELLIKSLMRQ